MTKKMKYTVTGAIVGALIVILPMIMNELFGHNVAANISLILIAAAAGALFGRAASS